MQINGFEIEEYNIYNIPEGATRWTCPVCSHTRKKSNEKCMSVFWDTGLGQCNHCGARVQLHTYKKKTRDKTYVRPQNINTTNLSDKVVKWFESRGISQQTLKNARISDCITNMPTKNGVKKRTAIMFNYYLDGELINVKYRDAEKNFKLISGAEKIFYNIDNIRTSKICVVTEGEIDCLSFMEVGIMDVVSIPNGSSLKSVNLDYLDSAIEYFDNKDWIYLALDTDAPGLNTRKEFIRRLGAERCKIIEFGEYKDANEVLMNLGAQALRDCFDNAKEVPIENVSSLRDWEKDYDDFLVNGMSGGYKIGKPYFDDIFSTYTGQFITVTGIPSCVTGDTEVLMRDGSTKQIKDIIIGDEIVSISKEYKAENDVVINKWNSGIKDVYELKLQSGKTIKATKEHGFLSFDGWRRFKNINIGDFIAVKNNVEFDSNTINVDIIKLAALWIAEGNKNHNSFYFSSSLEELILDVKDICRRNGLRYSHDGKYGHIISEIKKLSTDKKRYISNMSYTYRKRNGVSFEESVLMAEKKYNKRIKDKNSLFNPMDVLNKLGLIGMKTDTLRVPNEILKQNNDNVAHFLNYLFACDGWFYGEMIGYSSNSKGLCLDVSSLLSRFGITSYVNLKKVKYNGGINDSYVVNINGYDNVKIFRDKIGIIGKNDRIDKYLSGCKNIVSSKLRDYVPSSVKTDFMHGDKYYKKNFGFHISKNDKSKKRFSRKLASIIAHHENNTELINKTSNNVRWEQVVGITYLGKVETYDIEVKKNHNFIANEIVVHNSGKSDWVDEMCIGYNREYGWKIAYASPENKPNVIHASKIEAKLVGQWVKTKEQINTGWHQMAKKFIDDNFKFIDLERYSLTSVLEKAKALIRKFGIKVLVIDPYNKIRLIESLNKSITDYTNDYLATIDEFARVNDILVILVAHPRKPEKGEKNYEPSFYDIKGGGEFFDMSPHGLLVHRDFELNMVKVKVLKCKFAHLGENNAHCWFKWNRDNGRFSMYKNHNEDPMLCSSLIEDNTNIFAEEVKSQSDLPFEPIDDLPF